MSGPPSNSLLVPIVLWSARAPEHRVSAVLLSRGRNFVVTGSYSGQLCLWNLKLHAHEPSLEPRLLLVGHTVAVTALAECAIHTEETVLRVVTSAAEDGTLCSWDLLDGRCIASARPVHETPRSLTATRNQRFLVLCGNYSDMFVLDPETLTKLHTLRPMAMPNWMSAICTTDIMTGSGALVEGLLSLSSNGTLMMWTLPSIPEDANMRAFADQSNSSTPLSVMRLDGCEHAISLDTSEDNAGLILVVTLEMWRVIQVSGSKEVCHGVCPNIFGWSGGRFAGPGRLLVWGKSGKATLYSLPSFGTIPLIAFNAAVMDANAAMARPSQPVTPMRRTGSFGNVIDAESRMAFGSSTAMRNIAKGQVGMRKSNTAANMTTLVLPEATLEREFIPAADVENNVNPNDPSTLIKGSFPKMSFCQDMLICGDGLASIRMWLVTKEYVESAALGEGMPPALANVSASFDAGLAESSRDRPALKRDSTITAAPATVSSSSVKNCLPVAQGSFAHAWNQRAERLCDLTGPTNSLVSCTVMIDRHYLVRGYECGTIVVSTATAMFLDWMGRDIFADEVADEETGEKTQRGEHMFLRGHTGTITALLSPPASENSSEKSMKARLLISGSADLSVRVWRAFTGEPLYCFTGHVGVIDRLIYAPAALRQSQSCVVALSRDHSVSIYTLDDSRIGNICRLGGHAFPVDAVGWRRDDGYIVCRCTDGSVYVWQLGAGHDGYLDRHETGSAAEDIFAGCDGRGFMSNTAMETGNETSGGSLELLSLPIANNVSSVQLLVIDIRRLLEELLLWQSDTPSNDPHSDADEDYHNLETVHPTSNSGGPHARNVARLVLSFLLSWNLKGGPDSQKLAKMGLYPPARDVSVGIFGRTFMKSGIRATASLPLPCNENSTAQWRRSPYITAIHTLAIVGVANSMMNQNAEMIKDGWSLLVAFYCAILSDNLKGYEHPSIPVLMIYWQDPLHDLQTAARAILTASIQRRSPEWRSAFAERLLARLKTFTTLVGDAAGNANAPSAHGPTQRRTSLQQHYQQLLQQQEQEQLSLQMLEENQRQSMSMSTQAIHYATPPLNVALQQHPGTETHHPIHPDIETTLMLGVLGAEHQECLSRTACLHVARALMRIVFSNDSDMRSVASAVELLGKGFLTFGQHVDTQALIRKLILLTAPLCVPKATANRQKNKRPLSILGKRADIPEEPESSSSRHADASLPAGSRRSMTASKPAPVRMGPTGAVTQSSSLSTEVSVSELIGGFSTLAEEMARAHSPEKALQIVSRHALTLIAAAAPSQFVQAVGKEMMQAGGPEVSASVLRVVRSLIKKKPMILYSQLPKLVEIVVKCLDPHHASLRQAMLNDSTLVLKEMVKIYVNISVSELSQRLAVGTNTGTVIIHDLATATRAHVFEAHSHTEECVTALQFSPDGRYLCTYTTKSGVLRIWNISGGLFGLIGSQPKVMKEAIIPQRAQLTIDQLMSSMRIEWQSPRVVALIRDLEDNTIISL